MNRSLFLLYVSVVLVITYLQQEFVLLPTLQNLDITSEETKILLLERWSKWRWIAFVVTPVYLWVRLALVSLCMFVGGFFFSEMAEKKYKVWWGISMKSQAILVAYSMILCLINISIGSDQSILAVKYSSLIFLATDSIDTWIQIPLSAVNLFEIVYWLVLAQLVHSLVKCKFSRAFKFVMSTYGTGYLFYIVLLMFLTLYLS